MNDRKPPGDAGSGAPKGRPDVRANGGVANATMRIDLGELDRLRQASRGPLPGFAQLVTMLGRSLDDPEVEDLGLREKKLPGGSGYSAASKALGIEVTASRTRAVEAILLHSQNHDGFHAWPGDLGGLSFSSTQAELKKLRGLPTQTGPGWDRWDSGESSLRVEYGEGGVRLFTLLGPGAP